MGNVFNHKRFRLCASISGAALSFIMLLFIFPLSKNMDYSNAAPVPSTTELSMTTPEVELDLEVNDLTGTFLASEPASFSVVTNNYTGYTLSINAKTDDENETKLINGEAVLNSIEMPASDGNSFANGAWGYKPSKYNSEENDKYLPSPTYAGSILNATNSANITEDEYTISLAAKADYTIKNGEYSNVFVLTAAANPVNYTIAYDKNTTDTVENMPSTITGEISDLDIYISSNSPLRTGYTFKGWCSGNTVTTDGVDSCSATIYMPGDLYAASMQIENTLALKAMWERNIYSVTYDLSGLNNLNAWDQSIPTTNTITYANNVSTVQIVGVGGWEIVHMPVAVKQNVEYELSFTAKGTNVTPLNSTYGGAGVEILNTNPTTNCSDCLNYSIATAYVEPNFNGTKTIKFKPTTDTVYFAINMGMLADGTLNQYEIGNFKLTEKIGYGQPLTKIPTLTPKNYTFNGYYTAVSGGTAISNATTVPASDITYYAQATANNYTLTVVPNGGSYNGKTSNTTVIKNFTTNQSYGLTTPSRGNYGLGSWSLSGSGVLARGNAAGTGSSKSDYFTQTIKTDADGSQYTNYKYTNVTASSTMWPSISYTNYSYTSGHTYRITFDVRLNTYTNMGYLMFRHSAFGNDYGGTPGYTAVYVSASDVGQGWKTFTMYRTFTGTTMERSGTAITISPRFEIYSAINAGNTGSVDFDIRNITIEDANTRTYLTPSGFAGWVYKFGMGNGTTTANWSPTNWNITYNYNGGSASNPATYNIETATFTLNNPTRAGYTFTGWSGTGLSGNTNKTVTITKGSTQARSYTANWSANSYYLDLNGYINSKGTGGLTGCGTADVYINGVQKANDVADYYTQWVTGTKYEIKDIKATNGCTYNGVQSGSLSGTIVSGNVGVQLKYTFSNRSFGYTGGMQSFTVPVAGTYKLEVWGAQGGSAKGGAGGYAQGQISLTQGTVIYIGVGGQGGTNGGYNGGGAPKDTGAGYYGGGGATHMSKNNAVLSSTGGKGNLYIVAGGGGGGTTNGNGANGGAGGGASGGGGGQSQSGLSALAGGGTQSGGGAGGKGQYCTGNAGGYGAGGTCSCYCSGGGGGYYGGGGSGTSATAAGSGGGGSGYTTGLTSASMQNGARTGNGQAKITYVK